MFDDTRISPQKDCYILLQFFGDSIVRQKPEVGFALIFIMSYPSSLQLNFLVSLDQVDFGC